MNGLYVLKPKAGKQTLADIYNEYNACWLKIRDHNDNLIMWEGEFEDMPIKFACAGFKEAYLVESDAYLEMIV